MSAPLVMGTQDEPLHHLYQTNQLLEALDRSGPDVFAPRSCCNSFSEFTFKRLLKDGLTEFLEVVEFGLVICFRPECFISSKEVSSFTILSCSSTGGTLMEIAFGP